MKYTKTRFLKDVAAEARALKINATKEELDKLNFESLSPHNRKHCIYGQMTDDCRSDRAVELITRCCKRFIRQSSDHGIPSNIDNVIEFVNGTESENPYSVSYLSTIESYINMNFSKNENLIDYLRGDRKGLVL